MKISKIALFVGIFAPLTSFATSEGVPAYYQQQAAQNANQASYAGYQRQGYTQYVGQSGSKQVVKTNNYSYQVPRATQPEFAGTMTANGVAFPTERNTSIYAGYARRFADFEFKTGVNSVLEWDDMVFNEIEVGLQHVFSVNNFDMFAYASYSHGFFDHGGMSMDYDLEPYNLAEPYYGIFTVSLGQETGKTDHLKIGLGAHHVWDVGGWKFSPSFGYEVFKHNLEMSDHLYPNPGIYLPLMTQVGDYVYGDENGNYYSLPVDTLPPDNWYQVCMDPTDIKVIPAVNSYLDFGSDLPGAVDFNPTTMDAETIWGVEYTDCVIIGGDGQILVDGVTHKYNTTWSGFYVGLEIEKQMTLTDKLRFYAQFGLPKYSSEGIWPNRDDWQQNPSFTDEGDAGAYSYSAELEYNMGLSDRLQLSLKVDTNYFHVGNIGGKLYVAEYSYYQVDEYGQYVTDDYGWPILITEAAHTEDVTDSLKHATWQSFGLHLGLKYSF